MAIREYARFKAAACHIAPVFLDSGKTVEKACNWIEESARNGASLIAFPETFIPGYPIWSGVQPPVMSHDYFKLIVAQAIRLNGPEVLNICAAAKRNGVIVSFGFTEGTTASVGCLWNSNLIINSNGSILNHRRKLVPTFYEKLTWANGDGRGLEVVESEVGRLGMLICGENTNPLARYTLIAQGEQVHISTFPATYPTRPLTQNGNYDLRRAIEIRAGAHSFEGKVFNIVTSGVVDRSMLDVLVHLDKQALENIERSPRAVSMIMDPTGSIISDVLCENEGIIYSDIDVQACIEPKQFHDIAGYYNRFDIFDLKVNRSAHSPVNFIDALSEEESQRLSDFSIPETQPVG